MYPVVRVRVIDPDITVRWPGEPRRWPAASCQLQLFRKLNEMSSIIAVKAPDNRIVFKVKSWLVHWTNKSPIPTEHMGTVGICPHLLLADTLTLFQSGDRLCLSHRLVPTWFENVPQGLFWGFLPLAISIDHLRLIIQLRPETHNTATYTLNRQ